jgi:hypothetical protein
MPQPSSPRATTHLSDAVRQHLNMYARAASAAGVGILALASPAQAKIVYTPANIPIPVNAGWIGLDLNNDGINDFEFSNTTLPGGTHNLRVEPAGRKSRVWAVESRWHPFLCAAALQSDTTVGGQSPFEKKHSLLPMAWGAPNTYGCPWTYVQAYRTFAYLGLKFRVKGIVHFGWARVQMNGVGQTENITGYAYETVGHKPIVTGKISGPDVVTRRSAGLGHLARGAAAIQTIPVANPTN